MDGRLQKARVPLGASLGAALAAFGGGSASSAGGAHARVSCVMVVDPADGDRLVGLVSEQDACRKALEVPFDAWETTPVGDFMVAAERLSMLTLPRLVTTPASAVCRLMARRGFKHLPIVADEESLAAVGVLDALSLTDDLCRSVVGESARLQATLAVGMAARERRVVHVREEDGLRSALRKMLAAHTTAAVAVRSGDEVVDGTGRMAGIVTLADVVRKVLAVPHRRGGWAGVPVSAVMTPAAVVYAVDAGQLASGADILGVLRTMAGRGFRHTPVVTPAATGLWGRASRLLRSTVGAGGGGSGTATDDVVAVDVLDILSAVGLLLADDGAAAAADEAAIQLVAPAAAAASRRGGPPGRRGTALSLAESEMSDVTHLTADVVPDALGAPLPPDEDEAAAAPAAGAGGDGSGSSGDGAGSVSAAGGPFTVDASAILYSSLKGLQAAYSAVPNGVKPTDRQLQRLKQCVDRLERELTTLDEALRDPGARGPETLPLYVASLCLAATAARASVPWAFLLGQDVAQLFTALQTAAGWLGRLRALYRDAAALGLLRLDAAGYPLPGAPGVPPLRRPMRVRRAGGTAADAPIEVAVHPRFAEARLLLPVYAGFVGVEAQGAAAVGGGGGGAATAGLGALTRIHSCIVPAGGASSSTALGLDVGSLASALDPEAAAAGADEGVAAASAHTPPPADALDAANELASLVDVARGHARAAVAAALPGAPAPLTLPSVTATLACKPQLDALPTALQALLRLHDVLTAVGPLARLGYCDARSGVADAVATAGSVCDAIAVLAATTAALRYEAVAPSPGHASLLRDLLAAGEAAVAGGEPAAGVDAITFPTATAAGSDNDAAATVARCERLLGDVHGQTVLLGRLGGSTPSAAHTAHCAVLAAAAAALATGAPSSPKAAWLLRSLHGEATRIAALALPPASRLGSLWGYCDTDLAALGGGDGCPTAGERYELQQRLPRAAKVFAWAEGQLVKGRG